VDKDLLFKPRASTASGMREDDVEVPGLGTFRVRALSRFEALHVQEADGVAATERRVLSLGLVDPKLTEAEVGRWQKVAEAGELDPVSSRIAELSGLAPESAKEQVKEFEANPDAEFRVLPGPEAGDAGVGSSGADG